MKLFKDYPDTLEDAKNGKSLGFTGILELNEDTDKSNVVDAEDVLSNNNGFDIELADEVFDENEIEQPWK